MKNTLKYVGLVATLALALTAVGCTEEVTNANQLVGEWVCTANSASNPGVDWGADPTDALKDKTVYFRTDGTYVASALKMLEPSRAEGYWSISDTRLYINANNGWKIVSFTENSLKLESYFMDGTHFSADTAGAESLAGPFVREFKRE